MGGCRQSEPIVVASQLIEEADVYPLPFPRPRCETWDALCSTQPGMGSGEARQGISRFNSNRQLLRNNAASGLLAQGRR